jgi:hypothetical protein
VNAIPGRLCTVAHWYIKKMEVWLAVHMEGHPFPCHSSWWCGSWTRWPYPPAPGGEGCWLTQGRSFLTIVQIWNAKNCRLGSGNKSCVGT